MEKVIPLMQRLIPLAQHQGVRRRRHLCVRTGISQLAVTAGAGALSLLHTEPPVILLRFAFVCERARPAGSCHGVLACGLGAFRAWVSWPLSEPRWLCQGWHHPRQLEAMGNPSGKAGEHSWLCPALGDGAKPQGTVPKTRHPQPTPFPAAEGRGHARAAVGCVHRAPRPTAQSRELCQPPAPQLPAGSRRWQPLRSPHPCPRARG